MARERVISAGSTTREEAQFDELGLERIVGGELLERVWPGLVVEEANVHVQVSLLRKAFALAKLFARDNAFITRLTVEPQANTMTIQAVSADTGSTTDTTYIALLPTTLREILEPIGYHADEIIDRWAERGWLLSGVRKQQARGSSVKSRSEVIRIHGAPMRVFRIGRAVVDEQVAEEEMEIPHGT